MVAPACPSRHLEALAAPPRREGRYGAHLATAPPSPAEPPQHVVQDARDVVVALVHRQCAAERDRPHRQHLAAAVVTVSPGAMGGFGANHHLRQSLVFLDMPTLLQPEAYIGGIGKLFDEAGMLSAGTSDFLGKFLTAFAAWVERNQA